MSATRKIFFLVSFATFVAGALIFSSCRKQIATHPSWDAQLLTPLLKSSLTLDDLLADSVLQTNADNSVSIVLRNKLYGASLTDLAIKIPDTTIKVGFSLETINLSNKTITFNYTLGAMCQQLGDTGAIIILFNGSNLLVPAISGISTPDNDLDATQFFQSADVESGYIDLTLDNGLPLTMSSIVFQVRNKIDQQVLTQDTFLNLLPNQTQTKSIDLSGKHVEGTLVAKILDMSSPGGYVLIDTSDAIAITMVAHDIKVDSATAVFPSQNLIDDNNLTTYHLSGGAELNNFKIKSGQLTIKIQSTLPQPSHFEYTLPSATDGSGNSISLIHNLPAAPSGSTSSFSQTFDLAGYSLDLTGVYGTDHNTFYSHLIASIDSSGLVVTISKNDSFFINYTLKDLEPEYISGYVGQQIVNVGPDETPFTAFKNIKSGTLSLENVDVNLSIKNGIGVEGRLNLYNLTSINSSTGNQIPLTWTLLNKPLSIPPATDNPFTPSYTTFLLNNSNSNIAALVSNLPTQLKYSLDVFINPFGNISNYHDFAYDSSGLEADLDVTVPLSLIASELVLVDTLDFTIGATEEGDATIKDGTFNLIVYNGFPISASPQLYFYDDNFNLLDVLFTSVQTVAAAPLNDQCVVSGKTKSVLTTSIDEAKMARIRSATKAVLVSTFNTASHPNCTFLKIYADYSMDVQLTGLFTFYTGY
ncbi:MAG TPA: hypothetical protein VE978_16470 [Chitinophagales bacterium]|nr:hypothetical protein [Chitinophagales bacterium]